MITKPGLHRPRARLLNGVVRPVFLLDLHDLVGSTEKGISHLFMAKGHDYNWEIAEASRI